MKRVYEMDTWRGREDLNRIAIEAAKNYSGTKYTVAVGDWNCGGVATYLVFADTKEDAKRLALAESGKVTKAVKVRDVTNAKKYQN